MVTRDGELVQLSRTEWLLLQHLAANAGKVVLHTELLTKVWGPEYRDDLQYLRVWVSRVRRKLGAEPGEPGRIKTFQGIGYLLDVEPPVVPESPQVVSRTLRPRSSGSGLRPGGARRQGRSWRVRRPGPSRERRSSRSLRENDPRRVTVFRWFRTNETISVRRAVARRLAPCERMMCSEGH